METPFTKTIVESCCGKSAITYSLSFSIIKEHVSYFEQAGFMALPMFVKSGILYVEDINLIASGSFGSTYLTIKCKTNNCAQMTSGFENVLNTIYGIRS